MMRSLFFVALVLCGNSYAKRAAADMSASRASFAPEPPSYQIPIATVQSHNQLMQKMITVAAILKVESITSRSQDVGETPLASITNGMVKKMAEHPQWNIQLNALEVKAITPHLELLKATFGEKSYGWAWFLKQTGKTAEAKQILTSLFDERCAVVMMMTETHNRQSPMAPVVEVEQALQPLLTAPEKAKVQKKMQDVKVHVSNLKDYTIMT